MAYVRVWKFRPLADAVAAFEEAYGPTGDWARLFGTAPGFMGTTLLRSEADPPEYLTLDRWTSREAYEAFRRERAAEFAALDKRCEALTALEEEIGSYDEARRDLDGR